MDDTEYLCDIALGAIARIRARGAKKHPGESWRKEPVQHHLGAVLRHIGTDMSQDAGYKPDKEWGTHLENAICRLAMALALEQEVQHA